MAKGDTLHHPDASWRQPVSHFGFADSTHDEYKDRLYTYGGGDEPDPRMQIQLSFGDWTVPFYYMTDATPGHTIRLYQSGSYEQSYGAASFNRFGGFPRGSGTVPWNDAWEPGQGGDSTLILIDDRPGPTYGNVFELWVLVSLTGPAGLAANLGGSFLNGSLYNALATPQFDPNNTTHRLVASVSWYPNSSVYELRDSSTNLGGFRGAGTQKTLGVLQADELLRAMAGGTIGHALNMTVANPMFGPTATPGNGNTGPGAGYTKGFYEFPAKRYEHEDPTTAFFPASWASLTFDQKRQRCVPHGMRYCITHTDGEIDAWADSKSYSGTKRLAAVTLAKHLRDYGWLITETGGYGTHIETTGGKSAEEKAKWQSTGLWTGDTFDDFVLKDLITSSSQLRIAAAPNRDGSVIGVVATPAPAISSLSTATGLVTGGTVVNITGTNFTGATSVLFGTVPSPTFSVQSPTTIQAVAPAGTVGTTNIQVVTPVGTSPTSPTTQFVYTPTPTPAPVLSAVSPLSGTTAGGTVLTLTGTNLLGMTAVNIDGTPVTPTNVTSTTAQVTTPAHSPGIVTVTVTTPGGTSG